MRNEIDKLLKEGIAEHSNSEWSCPVLIIPKANDSLRLVVDYRWVNQWTLPDPYPLSRIDDLIDAVGSAKYLTTQDCTKGYWAVPLDDDAIPLTGFVTPFGHFNFFPSYAIWNAK